MFRSQKLSVFDATLLIPALFAVTVAWWLLPASTLASVIYVVLVECLFLVIAFRLLSRNLPKTLVNASEQNCYRQDGTRSQRRVRLEAIARRKWHTDILAGLLLILLTGNGLAVWVHYYVIPLPVGVAAALSFRLDEESWKAEITRRNIDTRFESSYRDRFRVGPKEAYNAATRLWDLWPLVIMLGLAWSLGALYLLVHFHRRALADFSKGVRQRTEIYIKRDLSQMQRDFE